MLWTWSWYRFLAISLLAFSPICTPYCICHLISSVWFGLVFALLLWFCICSRSSNPREHFDRSTYYLVANLEWFRWFLAGRKTVKKFSINTLFIVFIYSHSHEATNEQKTEVLIKLGSDLVERECFGILIARWLSINIGCIALRRVNLYHLRKLSTLKFVRKTIFNLFEERAHAHIRLSASSSLWCRVSSALKKAFFVGLISMLSAKCLLLCCNVQHTEMH